MTRGIQNNFAPPFASFAPSRPNVVARRESDQLVSIRTRSHGDLLADGNRVRAKVDVQTRIAKEIQAQEAIKVERLRKFRDYHNEVSARQAERINASDGSDSD